MTVKSFILAAYIFASSIFRCRRGVSVVSMEKSKIDRKMEAVRLAADHWRYVEGVLLRHGVPIKEVVLIGDAYRAGFLRGWSLAWYSRFFGIDCSSAVEWEWRRFASSRSWECRAAAWHFRDAFLHGWKHRMEENQ